MRTGGPRATDTFHVVDDLRVDRDGRVVSRFLASGVRYVPGAEERLHAMRAGHRPLLRDEPRDPVNSRAILIDAEEGMPVGHVPDWLLDDVHPVRAAATSFDAIAERVNPDAPAHLRLVCRIEASGVDVPS